MAKFVTPGDTRNVHRQLMAACDHDMLQYTPADDVYRNGPVPVATMADLERHRDEEAEVAGLPPHPRSAGAPPPWQSSRYEKRSKTGFYPSRGGHPF